MKSTNNFMCTRDKVNFNNIFTRCRCSHVSVVAIVFLYLYFFILENQFRVLDIFNENLVTPQTIIRKWPGSSSVSTMMTAGATAGCSSAKYRIIANLTAHVFCVCIYTVGGGGVAVTADFEILKTVILLLIYKTSKTHSARFISLWCPENVDILSYELMYSNNDIQIWCEMPRKFEIFTFATWSLDRYNKARRQY